MKKIVFVEPYVSKGGHTYKHLTVIPPCCERLGIHYLFVTEEGSCSDTHNGNICCSLKAHEKVKSLDSIGYRLKRKQEFAALLERERGACFVFLTTFEEDFDAWVLLFQDDSIRRSIIDHDTLIIIHSTAGLYRNMLFLTDEEKKCLHEVKKHVFFGLYTRFQAHIARSLVSEMNFFRFVLPTYDYIINAQKNCDTPKYVSYIGRYDFGKGPHRLLQTIDQVPESYLIHFYPVTKNNFFLYLRYYSLRSKKVQLITDMVSKDTYSQMIHNTKIGLLPYDSYEYAIRATGILEEYMLAEVPVVVPKDSWLSYFLAEHNGGGAVFDEYTKGSFSHAIQRVLDGYPHEKEKARNAVENLAQKMCMGSFIETIKFVAEDRSTSRFQTHDGEHATRYPEPVRKGKAFYFTYVADGLLKKGKIKQAAHYVDKAFQSDRRYWKTYVIEKKLNVQYRGLTMSFINTLIQTDGIHNYHAFLSACANDIQTKPEKGKTQFRRYCNKHHFLWYISLDAVQRWRMIITDRMIRKESIDCLMQFIKDRKNVSRYEYLVAILFYACGDIRKAYMYIDRFIGMKLPSEYKAHASRILIDILLHNTKSKCMCDEKKQQIIKKLLSYIEKKKHKTVYDDYYCASIRKKIGDFSTSYEAFRVITESNDEKVLSGALFHLGELDYICGNTSSAQFSLERCVSLEPRHEKAKELLEVIGAK